MGELGERLKQVRKLLSYTQKGISEAVGSKLRSWQDYESGNKVPGSAVLKGLSDIGVNTNWVLTGSGNTLLSDDSSSDDDFVYVDAFNIEASAGSGLAADNEYVCEQLAFRRDWLKREGIDTRRLAVIRAKGDSMYPTIADGDSLLVETYMNTAGSEISLGLKSNSTISQEGLYVIRVDGNLMVKRLQLDLAGGILINSDNKAYQQLHIEKDQRDSIIVAGKVAWAGRRL